MVSEIVPLGVSDIGAGGGRDIKYIQNELNYRTIGIDNSITFVDIIKTLIENGEILQNSIVRGDMCQLMFKDNIFDAVRHNASLLHVPLITKGCGADKAIKECYRVLKPNGILYILVKKGNKVEAIDTDEGFGPRIYQLFEEESLGQLLIENKFHIIESDEHVEDRGKNSISWLYLFAQKTI